MAFLHCCGENGIKGKCWRLLRKMYEKVENKVIFGDFESDCVNHITSNA